MDKIKIEVNGYTVYANNTQEARAILGVIPPHQVPRTEGNVIPIKIDGRRNNGGNKKHPKKVKPGRKTGVAANKWLPEEVQYIAENLDKGGLKSISRSKYLLERHTRGGILMMGWKVNKNPSRMKCTPEIQAIVDEYQKRKMNKVLYN